MKKEEEEKATGRQRGRNRKGGHTATKNAKRKTRKTHKENTHENIPYI